MTFPWERRVLPFALGTAGTAALVVSLATRRRRTAATPLSAMAPRSHNLRRRLVGNFAHSVRRRRGAAVAAAPLSQAAPAPGSRRSIQVHAARSDQLLAVAVVPRATRMAARAR